MLVELVQAKAIAHPEKLAYIWLADGEQREIKLTYGELDSKAKAIAAELQFLVKPGCRALLVYPYSKGLEFITAFVACLYAGVVAVPCHPPTNRLTTTEVQTRLLDAEATIVLSDRSLSKQLPKKLKTQSDLHWLDTTSVTANPINYVLPQLQPESLAFLQYTSGSTGEPKGVMITHSCLRQNQEILKQAFGHNENSIGVGWLPLFHDMGLIGNVLQPLYLGICCVLMSPISFIQKPIRWLEAISKYQATTSGAPNFAYDLLCDRVKPQQIKQLNLSSWQVAFCGAEPIQEATIKRFIEKCADCHFKETAFYPCYGMAEATLMITGGDYQQAPQILHLDKSALENNQVQIRNKSNSTSSFLSAGHPWLDGELAIVNPKTATQCSTNEIGEIWFSGSSIGHGYWQQPDKTQATFQAKLANKSYLRTGDLGFIYRNELYITGRLNDVLVLWGLNYYPQHIEQTVCEAHSALQPNAGAAFTINLNGRSQLIIAQEIKRTARKSFVIQDVVEAIRWAIFQQHFLDVGKVILLSPGSLPKTSSGKVRRQACKTEFLAEKLPILAQWSLPKHQFSDLTSLMERYTNPLTYLNILIAITRGKFKRFLNFWSSSVLHQREKT